MTEDEMKTKACHRTMRGEVVTVSQAGAYLDTLYTTPAKCIGSDCIAFRGSGSACYCADLKRDA